MGTTWDPSENGGLTLSNGNLTAAIANTGVNAYKVCYATKGISSGKVYWEVVVTAVSGTDRMDHGVSNNRTTSGELGSSFAKSTGMSLAFGSAQISVDGLTNNYSLSQGSTSWASGQVLMFALDASSGFLYYGLNGTWANAGAPASGTGYIASGLTSSTWYPAVDMNGLGGSASVTLVTSSAGFTYTPPSGFIPLDGALFTQTVTATSTSSTALVRSTGKQVPVTCTSASAFLRKIAKTVAVTCTSASAFLKACAHKVTVASTTATSVVKQAQKIIAATCTTATTLVATRVFLQAVNVTCTSAVSLMRSIGKHVAVTCTSATTMLRAMTHTVTVGCSSAVGVLKSTLKVVSATCVSSVTLFKGVMKIVPVTCSTAVSLIDVLIAGLLHRRRVVLNIFRK